MRPRLLTAENGRRAIQRQGAATGFNEAAASHRGKPRHWIPHNSVVTISFNEAAASHRGKHELNDDDADEAWKLQ